MNKFLTLLFFSTVLLVLGYNFTFNSVKTISKFISFARYHHGTRLYKTLTNESNTYWVRICGIVLIIFALLLFTVVIILLVKRYSK